MNIVFLDIDGVLNHNNYDPRERSRLEACDLTDDGEKYKRMHCCMIDPKSVEVLNELVDTCQFVISSTWRKGSSIEELQYFLDYNGFKGKIIGTTPVLGSDCVRGNEIYRWLKDHSKLEIDSYVIFDDDSDMLLWQAPYFFHVDGWTGITPNVVYKAKRFMARNKYLGNS
jgi:hypothetical protein